jgi:hypothetical protein
VRVHHSHNEAVGKAHWRRSIGPRSRRTAAVKAGA